MKKFIYCESTDGGMETNIVSGAEGLKILCGWKDDMCRSQDEALERWMQIAEIGEHCLHRLGVCIRLKDE